MKSVAKGHFSHKYIYMGKYFCYLKNSVQIFWLCLYSLISASILW